MVIDLRELPHHPAQYLLPWHVNGTLDAAETALVETHLEECADCRAELEAELALAAGVPAAARRLAQPAPEPGLRPSAHATLAFFRRPIPLGWAIAGQLAAAALLLAILLPGGAAPEAEPYRVLAAPEAAPSPGNVLVLFAPEAPEQAVRAALSRAGARIVDGPTESGAYVLQVAPQGRQAALAALRRDPQVALAEPLGGERP